MCEEKYEKEYGFKTITDDEVLNEITTKIINVAKNNVNVIELGTGIGAITIPIMNKLIESIKKNEKLNLNLNWWGYDYDENALKYFKNKLNSIITSGQLSGQLFSNNKINLSINGSLLNIVLSIEDIERGIINNSFPSSKINGLYDLIFMPSFLYHITFWKDVLIWAYDHLKENGFIILGYPSGVWTFPEKGYLSVSAESIEIQEKVWFEAWQDFYKKCPNYYLFFRRHYNELHDILLGRVRLEKIIETELNPPDITCLKDIINNKGFGFTKSGYPFEFKIDEKIIDELVERLNGSKGRPEKNGFKYSFEILKKTEKEINIINTFPFNHSLNAKSLDVSYISNEPKLANQLLNYGIVKALLGEGILKRDNNVKVIGSYVGYHLNYFIKGSENISADNFDVMFFSLPNDDDKRLNHYRCFYSVPKSAPITEILKTLLPKTKPFCKFLVLEYEWINENYTKITTEYDHNKDIAKINIKIPESYKKNEKINKIIENIKKDNKNSPQKDGLNEIIVLPYSKRIDDSCISELLNSIKFSEENENDELKIFDFFASAKIGQDGKDIKQRLFLLAYFMLKSGNKSSIGIPMKLILSGEQKLLGILWLVYDQQFSKIEKNEIPILDIYLNSVINPIISRINLALMDLMRLELDIQQLKTAIISILIDSYAHNISAHSLAALKWWIELRHKMLDKRFYVNEEKGLQLENLLPSSIKINQQFIKDTSEKYYENLGLTDSKYNKEFFSLFDYLQFGAIIGKDGSDPNKSLEHIFSFSKSDDDLCQDKSKGVVSNISKQEKEGNSKTVKAFFPSFPVPIDYALFPFFKFLRDKGAFWSGVTRDTAYGGESKTWYQILWEDFANNPLYLGTIAKSEKISKVNLNLAVKTDDGWIKGRFVTIDMSIIDEESNILSQNNSFQNEKNKIKKEDCNFNSNCSVDYSKYTKYAFVKLGGCFKAFREELSKDKYNVFLPGGLIGEHALFTIFENTLRNIKHYKNKEQLDGIRENGIDFWISIEDERLSLNYNEAKKPELFKVKLWLAHDTDLVKFDDNKELKECLWKKVTDSTLKSVLDENGSPRMGGNSQDKACAAMLFNNKFISVESKEGDRNSFYYPWIHFTTNNIKKHYTSENDLPNKIKDNQSYYNSNENSKESIIKEYIQNLKPSFKGCLKKYFYLWKSEDYFLVKNHSDLLGENISRFKFVILSDDVKDGKREELIDEIRENGILRLLYKKNDKDSFSSIKLIEKLEKDINKNFKSEEIDKIKNESLKTLYDLWLKDWLKYDDNFKIALKKDQNRYAVIVINNDNIITTYHRNKEEDSSKIKDLNSFNVELLLSHGGDDQNSSCNVRSHGHFWGKYFVNAKDKAPEDLGDYTVYDKNKEYLLMDLVEILATRIEIFDNRINLRMSALNEDKRKNVFGDQLRLNVYEEKTDDGKDKSAIFRDCLENIKSNNEPLILIIHLSYIEALGYPEENINIFIENHLKNYFEKENFIFVLTSGRGRDSWKKNLDNKYRKQTIFKPVESLIGAVEAGLSYNDNFDVKHNLIKVIFGS